MMNSRRVRQAESLRILSIMLAAMLTVSGSVCAQKVHIKGRITDENGGPVELATVNESHQMVSTISNLQGQYEISPSYRDTLELVFRMVGHETRRRTLITPSDTVVLDVVLPTSGYALQGVTISDMRRQTDANQIIDIAEVRLNPDATGGSVESVIATQAGVSSHNELSSQYNVRGGNFDENSVYVNGTEILRPLLVRAGQQEGLSFVNPDMVQSISFSTGGFSAVYGDKMSSVLDITYRQPEHFEAKVAANLLGASIYIGAGGKKFSFSNSVRYKTNRYLLGTLDTQGEYQPNFLDYQVYAVWKPSEKWSVGLIGNIALNSYRFTPTDRNTTFGTIQDAKSFKVYFDGWEKDKFNTLFGMVDITRKIDSDNSISLKMSAFGSDESETYDISSQYWLDDVIKGSGMGVGTFFEHARNRLRATVTDISLSGTHRIDAHTLRWGADIRHEKIDEKMREWETRDSAGYFLPNTMSGPLDMVYSLESVQEMESNRMSAYLQDTWKINAGYGLFTLNGGVRVSYWNWNEELLVSPRVSIGFIPASDDNLTLRLSGGLYYQAPFYKELKDSSNVYGMGHITLNRNIKSQRSIQVVIGGDYHFRMFGRPFKFTVEAYYKKLDNLIPYNLDNVRIVYYGKNCSHGYAYGIDTKLFGEFVPGADSWISFSLMKTQENIGGHWVPRPTDQRYNLSIHFTDFFPNTDRWQMTLRGCLADGLPFGPSHTGREEATFRAPAYKRVDIGMSYRLLNNENHTRNYGWAKYFRNIWLGLDCFNLLGINNVNSYYWITDVTDTQYAVPNYLTGRQINFRILLEL